MQSFVVSAYPRFLSSCQIVPVRFDLQQHEFAAAMNEEIRPARTSAPVVLDEIAEDFDESISRDDLNQPSGDLDALGRCAHK
jgi:hypothetical protein